MEIIVQSTQDTLSEQARLLARLTELLTKQARYNKRVASEVIAIRNHLSRIEARLNLK